jgi:transitional endoplasmic reticulum ATPase
MAVYHNQLSGRFLPKISLSPSKQMKHIQDFWFGGSQPQQQKNHDSINNVVDPSEKVHGFSDIVGGVPSEVKDFVESLKDPTKYIKAGVKIPKGILLVGAPGTGKTSLARALAQEIGCAFVSRAASDFIDRFVGQGANNVRSAFSAARYAAYSSPYKRAVLFIDEIDAIGKRGETHVEGDQTINALLKEMDGIVSDPSLFVVAATNFVENLDPALVRSGRFKVIEIPMPNEQKRLMILQHYCKNRQLSPDVNLTKIAAATNNFSPADLEHLVNEAATKAMHANMTSITMDFLIQGLKEIWIERKSRGEKDVMRNMDALTLLFGTKESSEGIGFKALAGDIEPEMKDVLHYLQHPDDFKYFGVVEPRGILLVGPPGSGKTSLVRALAQEAGCEFVSIKGSEFIAKYVGVGAENVRKLFEEARKKAAGNEHHKTIIFIDEVDAIGSRAHSGEDTETRRTIAELLGQMEGFECDNSILVIAATNCPDLLDPALLRPGRFDLIIEVPLPNKEKREAILQFYCKKRPMDKDVSFSRLAQQTNGMSPADLKNLVNEAAKLAMRIQAKTITMEHFVAALEHIAEMRTSIQSQIPIETMEQYYGSPSRHLSH